MISSIYGYLDFIKHECPKYSGPGFYIVKQNEVIGLNSTWYFYFIKYKDKIFGISSKDRNLATKEKCLERLEICKLIGITK